MTKSEKNELIDAFLALRAREMSWPPGTRVLWKDATAGTRWPVVESQLSAEQGLKLIQSLPQRVEGEEGVPRVRRLRRYAKASRFMALMARQERPESEGSVFEVREAFHHSGGEVLHVEDGVPLRAAWRYLQREHPDLLNAMRLGADNPLPAWLPSAEAQLEAILSQTEEMLEVELSRLMPKKSARDAPVLQEEILIDQDTKAIVTGWLAPADMEGEVLTPRIADVVPNGTPDSQLDQALLRSVAGGHARFLCFRVRIKRLNVISSRTDAQPAGTLFPHPVCVATGDEAAAGRWVAEKVNDLERRQEERKKVLAGLRAHFRQTTA